VGLLVLLAVAACSPAATSAPTKSSAEASATVTVTSTASMASQSPTESPTASPVPKANVEAARLLDAQHGWAVASRRLLVTADGGSSWRDVTPPGGFGDAEDDFLLGVEFLDIQHGWVAVREDFTAMSDPSYGRIDVWRTTDGGQHWAKTQLPKAVINQYGEILPPVQFDFLDASHGFVFLSGNIAKGGNDSDLYWTADGGQTWSADRPTGHTGIEGTVGFATANDGVVVNPPRGSGIAATHDGGRTWTDAAVPRPPELAGAQPYFGEPVFFGGRSGLVSIEFQMDTTNVSWVYRTSDAGSSWVSVVTIPPGFSTVSLLDKEHWIESNGTETVRTVDGGATWTHTASTTPAINLGTTQFVDASTGWGLESETGGSLLFATTDGGITWRSLIPGTATTGPSPSASPLSTATLVPSDQPVPAVSVDHPTLTVSPASHLTDGQAVEVRVTGFGLGGKVWLSECASAADATSLGCGRELAGQPFLVTDDSRAGSSTFTVSAKAPIKYPSATVETCANRCVIVATLGDGYPYVVAPISFAGG
jgi:photosystem II stability/assembly factor-like uncharacterized protein